MEAQARKQRIGIRRSWTPEYKKLVAQRAQNEPVYRLSKELDIAQSVLANWRKKFGHSVKSGKPGPAGISEEVKTATLATLANGGSPSKVAKGIGVAASAVNRWKNGAGLKIKPRPVYSPEVKADAIKSYDVELPAEICKRLGITHSTLRRWRIDAGLPMRGSGTPKLPGKTSTRGKTVHHSPEFKAEAVRRYDTESTATLCKDLGIGMSTIRGWRNDAGLPMRSRGKRVPTNTLVAPAVPATGIVMGVGRGLPTPYLMPPNGEPSKAVSLYNVGVRTGMALAEIRESTELLLKGTSFDRAMLSEYIYKIRQLLSNLG